MIHWLKPNIEDNDFLFYDMEVFAHNALVVFKDIDGNIVNEYHLTESNRESFPWWEIKELIKDKVLVGYNNYHYDDFILTAMIDRPNNTRLKRYNDTIIKNGEKPFKYISSAIHSLDAMQQITKIPPSLKKIEANIGMDIEETPISFEIERELTDEELELVFKYCRHDVDATIKVFKMRWNSYFLPKIGVVNMLPENMHERGMRWKTTTITQILLAGGNDKIIPKVPEGGYIDFDKYDFLPKRVIEMWKNPEHAIRSVKIPAFDCNFIFAFGGIHGAPIDERKRYSNVKLLDVASMYPNLVMNLNALEQSTETYRNIVEERLKIKHVDPVKSEALKLIINSTYGLMRPEYSSIKNVEGAEAVCFLGQISLFDLSKRLYEAGYKVINANTDGVAFTGSDEDTYLEIWEQWEKDYNLTLELSEFQTWIQKDVNNYIAIDSNGKIKVKGDDVGKYHDSNDFTDTDSVKGKSWFNVNSCQVVTKAIVDRLLYNKNIYDTLTENLDKPIMYQFVLQAGSTYNGNIDSNGNKNYQRLNRVFAVKPRYAEKAVLYKYKELIDEDTNEEYIQKVKYAKAPNNMKIINGDLSEVKDFEEMIDISYYANLCEHVLERWL